MENDIENKTEMVAVETSQWLQTARPPEVVLEEARKAAIALDGVLKAKVKKIMMNGEQYLEFEDWQTLGRFYGVTSKIVSTEYVEYGAAAGFLARAVAIRSDGAEISAAEAMCLNDEEKWRSKPKYGYALKSGGISDEEPESSEMVWEDNPGKPGKKRPKKVRLADVPVPLFQLRSMAQTRACAKVLRNVLAWVAVLAGYRPTPAEELQDMAVTVDLPGRPNIMIPQAKPSSNGDRQPADSAVETVGVLESFTPGKPNRFVINNGMQAISPTAFKLPNGLSSEDVAGFVGSQVIFSASRNEKGYLTLTEIRLLAKPNAGQTFETETTCT